MSFQLSRDHKLILAKLVRDNKALLLGKHSPLVTNQKKHAKWTEIFNDLKSMGANLKDVDYLRQTTWDNMVRSTKKKKVNNESTGAAPATMTEVDEVILDVIGRDSAALNGLGQDDDAPTFGARNHGDSLSLLDITSQSSFNFEASSRFATPRLPLQPRAARASTPVDMMESEETQPQVETLTETHPSSGVKKQGKVPQNTLWIDDDYKELKVQHLKQSIEEQQLRMDLIRMQIRAEKARATFFEKAGMTLNGQHHMEISSSVEGHYKIPL
jgi:anti-sigma28 factor (negative regulator of flagellin synthesis)